MRLHCLRMREVMQHPQLYWFAVAQDGDPDAAKLQKAQSAGTLTPLVDHLSEQLSAAPLCSITNQHELHAMKLLLPKYFHKVRGCQN